MNAKDFHKIIQETNACDNSAMAESLKSDNPDVFNKKDIICENKHQRFKKHLAILTPLAIVSCLACILIPSILLTRKTNTNDDTYYCYSSEYAIFFTDNTLKEISIETDKKILYFDWYDIGSECVTSIYTLNETNETICINESIFNLETEDYIDLYVSPSKYVLDIYEKIIVGCVGTTTICGLKVNYCIDEENAFGIFTYNSYTYYLTLMYNTDTQRLFSLIDELLPD